MTLIFQTCKVNEYLLHFIEHPSQKDHKTQIR
jgi:hypothetical protein